MTLPIPTSYAPMEARLVATLPRGRQWQYEPKWDGFRCLAFRDGEAIDLRSRNGYQLARYFPELVAALRRSTATRFVLDAEIVVPVDGEPSFDHLLERIHPAAVRVGELARATPAMLIVFDLLVDENGKDLTKRLLSQRRAKLGRLFRNGLTRIPAVQLSPCTTDRSIAQEWLTAHIGTDGVIAKRRDCPYASGERSAMQKIKRKRTADCVVAGFRYASRSNLVGSLLLGLYDDDGLLHHCGYTSSFTDAERVTVTAQVRQYVSGRGGFSGREPGPSRWATERSAEWVALRPVLVCEVQYDHYSNDRFRHGTKLLRWRPDKRPRHCTFDQVRTSRRSRSPTRRKTGGVTAA